jgi:hypothetical protein
VWTLVRNLLRVIVVELLSGGEMLIRALADEGVEFLFGYPGGAVLHIYDAIFQQERVKHILVRHEQAAGHMADGYSRSTGKTGVGISHVWAWRNQYRDSYRYGVYGLHSDGDYFGTSTFTFNW